MFKPFQLGEIYSQNFICFKGVHDTLRLIRTAKGGLKIHTVWDDQLGLPDEKDHDILKDEIIVLTSNKAMK